MSNPNKAKGDRLERHLKSVFIDSGFPDAERTRAGYERDAGDIHLNPKDRDGLIICQAKDVKSPRWAEWLEQLEDQKEEAEASIGFLSVKRSRPGKKPLHLFVMSLEDGLDLIRRAKGIEH